jgi:hypothetical protein
MHQSGRSVEEQLKEVHGDGEDAIECATACARVVCTICLLADDPDVIKPDVLNDDIAKYESTGDQKYVEKAHRRGKVGWLVGAGIEIDPHFRRAHFALRWTGEGHKVPKIVPVKSAIVHRSKIAEVPTGYLD